MGIKQHRCRACGVRLSSLGLGSPRSQFCGGKCVSRYMEMDLMYRAESACYGVNSDIDDAGRDAELYEDLARRSQIKCYIRSSTATWEALLEFKDQLIAEGTMNPVNAGVWKSFWGHEWKPKDTMTFGDFEVEII